MPLTEGHKQFQITVPASLHARLNTEAHRRRISLNELCVRLLDDFSKPAINADPDHQAAPCVAPRTLGHGQCCEKAHSIPCVCTAAWRCPEHGDTHVGSHD